MQLILLLSLSIFIQLTNAGDDASVHVHVESAPGPDMGMRLPLFNYYKSAGGIPNPQLAAAFTKWHGDEVHSQGPDANEQNVPKPSSAEQPVHSHGTPDQSNGDYVNNYGFSEGYPENSAKFRTGRKRTGNRNPRAPSMRSGRTVPHERNNPRHYHGRADGIEAIPRWVLRKNSLKKYGLRKYIAPYTNIGVPRGVDRPSYFDEDAEPAYIPLERLVQPSDPATYDYD